MRRIITAHEQAEMLAPWLRTAMPALHRGLGISADDLHPDLRASIEKALNGEPVTHDVAHRLLDHIDNQQGGWQKGIGRSWSVDPDQANHSASPTNYWSRTKGDGGDDYEVTLHGNYSGLDRAVKYDELDDTGHPMFSEEQEWALQHGDQVNVTGVKVRKYRPGKDGFSDPRTELPVHPHVRTIKEPLF